MPDNRRTRNGVVCSAIRESIGRPAPRTFDVGDEMLRADTVSQGARSMYISATTVDDLLRSAILKIITKGRHTKPTKGDAQEITGVLLKLTNPRARLSRTEEKGKLFSCLGETLWYLARSNRL